MQRYDIINTLAKKYNYKTYLEIGTQHGQGFVHIDIPHKVCIDPDKKYADLTHEMTSDEYFEQYKDKFDIIFVDGLHVEEQSTRDIINALNCLNENGTIIVHDCLPHCEEFTQVCWNGTVFRSIIDLRYHNTDVEIQVVDTDNGCGIIRKGKQDVYNKVPYDLARTYDFFSNNRTELMNVISLEEFLALHG
jgi:predicted O-methyltransferase YrrM